MFFREAKNHDVEKMYAVRMSVKENKEGFAHLPGSEDYRPLLETGQGWVCEVEGDLLGFALVDFQQARVEALCVRPSPEDDFVCRMLHDMMTSWCFARGLPKLTLSAISHPQAEHFYLKAGWAKTGMNPGGETSYELENNLEPMDF
jgi:hypothetical protein